MKKPPQRNQNVPQRDWEWLEEEITKDHKKQNNHKEIDNNSKEWTKAIKRRDSLHV